MSARVTTPLLVTIVAGLIGVVACSPGTKHRLLTFFFDGVPPPASAVPQAQSVQDGDEPIDQAVISPPPPPTRLFAHTPYRDNRCGGCHDFNSGELIRPVEDGLCMTCHSGLITELKYVHGPVNVNACGLCHHHHASTHPNLLLVDPVATCTQCHELEDLSEGEHHAEIVPEGCCGCHDAHGGADRYFLKRSAP